MEASAAQTPPSISVTLALDPPTPKEGEALELSATAVLHASYPITFLDYWTIFNIHLAQAHKKLVGNFHCVDLDTNAPIRLQTIACIKRSAIRYELNHSDSQYFHTLYPELPYKFSGPCYIPSRELVPGHRYRLSIGEQEKIKWWRQGTKEEVLVSPDQELLEHPSEPSGKPIVLTNITPIEFTVPSDWKNIGASIAANVSSMLYAGARFWGSSTPPSITATLSLKASSLSGQIQAELFVTVVSHALCPITIWSYMTALNMKVHSQAFTVTHLDSDISVSTEKMFRTGKDCIVHPDDRYFHTLLPGQPFTLSKPITTPFLEELKFLPGLYRVAVKDSIKLSWWREGTREEIVPPPGQKPADEMYVASGEPIIVSNIEPVEFTVPVGR